MSEIRTIAVMGATGRQGRGVVDALSYTKGDIEYRVRPLTRSTTGKLAKHFKSDYPQLDLVPWEVGNTASLQKCFEGCYGAFVDSGILLPFETPLETWMREEFELGEQCREAAEGAGIKHLLYPSFPSILEASKGNINIRHFEIKHQIQLRLQASRIPCTILCPGPFYTDFSDMGYVSWENDVLVFSTPAQPRKRMWWSDPGHDIGWFGRCALDAGPAKLKTEVVPVCGPNMSYEELATKFSAVAGVKAEYRQCSVEEFVESGRRSGSKSIKIKEIRELGRWLEIAPDDSTCYGTISMDFLGNVERNLRVTALSWEKFLERTRWRGPLKDLRPGRSKYST